MAQVVTSRWVPVDLSGVTLQSVKWGWDRAWAYGFRGADPDVPYVASVRDDGTVTEYDLRLRGRITSAYLAGSEFAVCLGEAPAELVLLEDSTSGPASVVRDEDFLSGARVWMAGADGHDFYISEREDGRLTSGEAWAGEFPDVPGLWRVGDPQGVLVGSTDVVSFVAGLLRGADGEASVGLWRNSGDGGPRYPGGWERIELDPAPDGFTQINSSTSPEFAGHRDGRPVLFSLTQRLDAPEVELDPDHPQVLWPWAGQVALQSRNGGAQLWYQDHTGWTHRDLPPGRLDDAEVCTTSNLVWVVVDGALWRPVQ